MRVTGIDPAPNKLYYASVQFDSDGPRIVCVGKGQASDVKELFGFFAIEDPTGVLFSTTNSRLWSMTNQRSGEMFGATIERARYVSPHTAREWLGAVARQPQAPRKDREVRECLSLLFGDEAFDKPKLCPKRGNKSHGRDCKLCFGTGHSRVAGPLAELNTPHFRDAFVAALYAYKNGIFQL